MEVISSFGLSVARSQLEGFPSLGECRTQQRVGKFWGLRPVTRARGGADIMALSQVADLRMSNGLFLRFQSYLRHNRAEVIFCSREYQAHADAKMGTAPITQSARGH